MCKSGGRQRPVTNRNSKASAAPITVYLGSAAPADLVLRASQQSWPKIGPPELLMGAPPIARGRRVVPITISWERLRNSWRPAATPWLAASATSRRTRAPLYPHLLAVRLDWVPLRPQPQPLSPARSIPACVGRLRQSLEPVVWANHRACLYQSSRMVIWLVWANQLDQSSGRAASPSATDACSRGPSTTA
jgi:hypothetical protein